MTTLARWVLLLLVPLPLGCLTMPSPAAGSRLISHDVFFTLVDDSPEACAKLVDECQTKLADLPGIVFFAAGTRAADRVADVNDLDYHVSLHVYFEGAEAYDAYLPAPSHLAFVEANKANWSRVRVFDSRVATR